jgi:uncharacterized protein involved in exopolysaccharide biosynthesis
MLADVLVLEWCGMTDRAARNDEMAIDLAAIWAALWRARRWIVPVLVVVAVGAYAGLSMVPPKYRAEAKVIIEARGVRIDPNRTDTEAERSLLDQEGVASQVQLISSRDLARRVAQREKLDQVAEFRRSPGLLQSLLPFLKRAPVSPEEQVLDAYFQRLNVFQIERSRVITIEFTSGDPQVAARVANALVREYLAVQGEAKVNTSADTSTWLENEITGLRAKVAEAEQKVEQWRSQHDLFATNRDGTLVEQQLGGLNQQLTAVRADKAGIEARVEQLRRAVNAGQFDSAPDLQASPGLQRLKEREAALRSRLAELSATLLSGHPQIRALNAQLADVAVQERAEARRVLAALEGELKVADQRIRDLRNELGDGKATAARANESDIQLRALEREAKAQRDLLETFLARYREAVARQSDRALPPDARAISEASAPLEPYFPKIGALTFLITFAALMILVAFVILRELVSGRAVRRPATAEAALSPLATLAAEDDGAGPGDPDDSGPSGGRRPVAVRPVEAERGEDRSAGAAVLALESIRATERRASGDATPASAADLVEPDDVGWGDQPDAATAAAEPVTAVLKSATEPVFVEETDADTVETPAAGADGGPAPLADVVADLLGRRGGRIIAVTSVGDDDTARRGALVAATLAAERGRGCLLELTRHPTPLVDGPGLADLLGELVGFDAVIHRIPSTPAHVVPVGRRPLEPADLAGPRLVLTVDALASSYDHLVIDGGALDAASDALISRLAAVDAVIVVAEADEALRAERGRLRLATAGIAECRIAAAPPVVRRVSGRDAA